MQPIKLSNKIIGCGNPIFIIAEAGVNHNGNMDVAVDLIRKAKECGADCVKFQTFKAERIVTNNSPKAAYQLETTDPSESQYDMLKKLELSDDNYHDLISICRLNSMPFNKSLYSDWRKKVFFYCLSIDWMKVCRIVINRIINNCLPNDSFNEFIINLLDKISFLLPRE